MRTARLFALGASLTLTAALAASILISGGARFDRDRLATALGFGIDQVSLTGHKFTAAEDLLDALDLAHVRTLANFDAAAIRARFERLPWIKSAEITRIWPGQLAIRVSEREAFAVWQRTGGDYLIDRSGRVLSAIKSQSSLDLPRVAGEGANTEAAALLAQVARHSGLLNRIQSAERIAGRRWSLKLNSNVSIELPPDSEVAALDSLMRDSFLHKQLNQQGRVIDLRASRRIAIRPVIAKQEMEQADAGH